MDLTPAQTPAKTKQLIIAASIVIAVLIAAGAIVLAKSQDSDDAARAANSTSTSASPSSTASTFKDGKYSASGAYMSPGGDETIDVTVTIKNNTVTESAVTQNPSTPDARRYQEKFRDNYQQFVIGKKLSDIKLSHVSGSSLTSSGFNQALTQIQNKAAQS